MNWSKIAQSKLSYKLHIPILVTLFVGLILITGSALYNLVTISDTKHAELRSTYQNYLKRAYENTAFVAQTNAITLSQNPILVDALKTNQRDKALAELQKLSDSFEKNTSFKHTRIHVHTKDTTSFIRSWRPNDYGDDLSGFRDSISYLHQNPVPFVVNEIGRAGLLIRGMAPIFDGKEMIGSVEFIASYESIGETLKEDYGLNFTVLAAPDDSTAFNRFNPTILIGDRYLAMPKELVDSSLLTSLKDFQSSDIRQTGMMIRNGLFFTSIPITDIDENVIGCLMVANPMENINQILEETKGGLVYQILFMVLIDLIILFLLSKVINSNVVNPIKELSDNISDFSTHLLDKTSASPTKALLKRRDEIGAIARSFGRSSKRTQYLFKKINESQKINDEYLKAVYAGSIVSKGDPKGKITYVNEALCDATGYSTEELIGQPHSIFRHPSTPKNTFWEMWRTISQGDVWHGMLKNKCKDGTTFYANTTIVPILNNEDNVEEYIALRDDVTELVLSQRELQNAFLTDSLTNLGNRPKLIQDIEEKNPKYMAMLDIRAFKEINDFYGFELGDKTIAWFAQTLFDLVKEENFHVYRLQGDEFAIVSFSESDYPLEQFIFKIMKFIDEFQHIEAEIGGNSINLDLTVGIADKHEDLLIEADLAHKTAKKQNKTLIVYEEDLKTSQEYKNNIEWVKKMKWGLANHRFCPYYQPIVNNSTMQTEKHESLIRFEDADDMTISPFFFLDIAKKARLYPKLTQLMVEEVFKCMDKTDGDISVNISMEDILQPELLKSLEHQLSQHPEFGSRLVLEIVESESIESFDMVESFLSKLRAYGCKVAVDDFGTGYSNFEFLLNLNPDFIKIDGSLIKNLPNDTKAIAILESIIYFASKNNIQTIAEFVHSKEVLDAVIELGIDYSQGFYLGKPEPKSPSLI